MPRGPRIDFAGAVHHVMLRGVAKQSIFGDDQDRRRFLSYLESALFQTSTICFAWSLMGNHVHLALQTGCVPLATVMARINTSYAMYFNLRYGRVGHLFQNRYKNRLVEDETDLIGLVRYVHGNPLKDRVVDSPRELEHYPWAGHGAVVYARQAEPFHAAVRTRALFDDDPVRAIRRVRQLMSDYETNLRALGDGSAWSSAATSPDPIAAVCESLGVTEAALQGGRRTEDVSTARAIIAHLGDRLGLARNEVARRVGVSERGLRKACIRGRALAESATPEDVVWELPSPKA